MLPALPTPGASESSLLRGLGCRVGDRGSASALWRPRSLADGSARAQPRPARILTPRAAGDRTAGSCARARVASPSSRSRLPGLPGRRRCGGLTCCPARLLRNWPSARTRFALPWLRESGGGGERRHLNATRPFSILARARPASIHFRPVGLSPFPKALGSGVPHFRARLLFRLMGRVPG